VTFPCLQLNITKYVRFAIFDYGDEVQEDVMGRIVARM